MHRYQEYDGRDVAVILGGNRIPFARSNGPYAEASNQDMLTATLDGLVARFGAAGRAARRGRRRRRAQARARLQPHARVRARLARCDHAHAGLRRPAGVRHRHPGRARASPTRSRSARSTAGIAGGIDTTSDAPIAVNEDLRARAAARPTGPSAPPAALKLLGQLRPGQIVPEIPRNAEPRTGLSMGEHQARTDRALGHHARGAGRARRREPPAPGRRLRRAASSTTSSRPYLGLERDQNLRPDSTRREAGEAQAGVRRGRRRDDDRRQLDAAVRRRLRSCCSPSEEWAAARGCPCSPASSTPRRPRSTTCTATRAC